MSGDFVVYEDVPKGSCNSEVSEGHQVQHCYDEKLSLEEQFQFCMDSLNNSGRDNEPFIDSLTAWMNYHMTFDKKLSAFDTDLCDGVRIAQLLKSLDNDITLPYPLPKTYREKEANNYVITDFLAKVQDQDIDPEDKAFIAGQMCEGDLETLVQVLVSIGHHEVLVSASDPVRQTHGIEQIELWLQDIVGMSGNLFCHDIQSTNLEDPSNLVKLLNYCKIQMDVKKYNYLVEKEDMAMYCLDLIEKETGVPSIMINPKIVLETEDSDATLWYMFIRYLWAAEVYNKCVKPKSKYSGATKESPKEVVSAAIGSCYHQELHLNELEDNCKVLYDWIQSRIDTLKKEISLLDVGMDISSLNPTMLVDLYKIMTEEQTQQSKLKLYCYDLHCEIQRKIKDSGREPLAYHPTYNIHKIEKLWNGLVNLERRVEQKMQNYINHVENRHSLKHQLKLEMSKIRQWMKRWSNFFTSMEPSMKFNLAECRKIQKVISHDFSNEVENKSGLESVQLLTNIILDFSPDTVDQELIKKEFNDLQNEYKLFIKDTREMTAKFDKIQEEAADLEVLYSEMSEILTKLDDQIHELHCYYALRPHCTSLACCDKLSQHAKDTWRVLFEISHQIDAVTSLEGDIERLTDGSATKVPKNYLTSLTPKYIRQRWDALLLEATSLEEYVRQQREINLQHLPATNAFNKLLNTSAAFVYAKMLEVSAAVQQDDLKRAATIKKHLVETFDELYLRDLNQACEALDDWALVEGAFKKILQLRECLSHCVSTLDLVYADIDTVSMVAQEREINEYEMVQHKREMWRCASKPEQMILSFDDIAKKLPASRDDVLATVQNFAATVDPLFHRVTCSVWLNYKWPDLYSNTDTLANELSDSFLKLAANEHYILESDIGNYISDDNLKFLFKNITEYTGDAYDDEDDEEVSNKPYDYHRLISNLVGKHKTLLGIKPE